MYGISKLKVAVFAFFSLLLIWSLLYLFSLILEPSSPVKNLSLTNQTDHQVTISWVTDQATRGDIIVSRSGKFPLTPALSKVINRDDGDKGLKKEGFYTTHSVTVGNLNPNTIYYFRIYQGQRKMFSGRFKTADTLSTITSPHPVYGRVLMADKKTPLIGAIVYLQVQPASSSATPSAVLSTLTNIQGRWSIDLGSLRSKDLQSLFNLPARFSERIVVEGGAKGKSRSSTTSAKDQPWPDIYMNR